MPQNDDLYLILATPAAEVFSALLEKGIYFEFFSDKFFDKVADLVCI